MSGVRLRQAVLVAESLGAAVDRLRSEFALGEPFEDPGVGFFGLRNAVFAIGDTFLEVVSPMQDGTAAGRYLERHGDGGYMVMFQVFDIDGARRRARSLGIREVWSTEHDDIIDVHLHPGDIGGAIVAIDRPVPLESWRWGGPDWPARAVDGLVVGATMQSDDPVALSERWSAVLGAPLSGLSLAGVAFSKGEGGLVGVTLSVPSDVRRGRDTVEACGVRFELI